jgi:hypothetical protein
VDAWLNLDLFKDATAGRIDAEPGMRILDLKPERKMLSKNEERENA